MSDIASTTRQLRGRHWTRFGEEVSIGFDVAFYDVDMLGIVWHGHYFKYLDRARVALLHRHGLGEPEFVASGRRVLVGEAACRYLSPLRFGDRGVVTAFFTEIDSRLRVGYRIWNETSQKRVARAYTTLVFTDADGNLLWRTPDVLRSRILEVGPPR